MRAVLQKGIKMRDVKVRRKELLEKIKDNKEKHIKEYEEAVRGYKQAALNEIQKGMDKLRKQVENLEGGEMIRLAAVSFSLPYPESHEKDYNQVIAMLEMSVDEELTIKSDEFACYVMDDWDWMPLFKDITSNYRR